MFPEETITASNIKSTQGNEDDDDDGDGDGDGDDDDENHG